MKINKKALILKISAFLKYVIHQEGKCWIIVEKYNIASEKCWKSLRFVERKVLS